MLTLDGRRRRGDRRRRRRRLRQRVRQADRPPPAPAQAPPPSRPDPVPFGGAVAMTSAHRRPAAAASTSPGAIRCGAAVFRRGDAIWIVFDAAGPHRRLAARPKNVIQYAGIQSFQGPGYSAVRIITRAPIAFAAAANGSDWGVILEPYSAAVLHGGEAGPRRFRRPGGADHRHGRRHRRLLGRPTRRSATGSASSPRWPPSKGLPTRRDFVEFSMLQSAQGLAVAPRVDDLDVGFNGDIVTMSRPKGLALSSANAKLAAAAGAGRAQARGARRPDRRRLGQHRRRELPRTATTR